MKKLTSLVLIVFIVLAIQVPVFATSIENHTNLARYFPEDTDIFVSIRSDSGFIETLDGLLAQVDERMGGQLLNGSTLRETLSTPRGNFDESFGNWLGDTIAIGTSSVTAFAPQAAGTTPPIMVAFSVTNKDNAEAFLGEVVREGLVKSVNADGDIAFMPDPSSFDQTTYLLKDDVMIIWSDGTNPKDGMAFETSLADREGFADSFAMLPLDEYNIIGYVDISDALRMLGGMMDQMMNSSPEMAGLAFMMTDFDAVADAIGAQVFGFTIQEGRSLTIDLGQSFDLEAMADANMGVTTTYDQAPVNLDFAQLIPADAPLVIHAQGLGTQLIQQLAVFEQLATTLNESGMTLSALAEMSGEEEVAVLLEPFDLGDIAVLMRNVHRGMMGQTIEESFGWMSADYATYVRVIPENTLGLGVMLDAATLISVTDSDQASSFMDALVDLLEQTNVRFTQDGAVLTLSAINDLLVNFMGFTTPDLDMQIGMNDDVFVMGTRNGVDFALNPTAANLTSTAEFAAASAYFVEDTQVVIYLNPNPLWPIIENFAGGDPDIAMVTNLLSLIDSASITTNYDEDSGVTRFVLTISE